MMIGVGVFIGEWSGIDGPTQQFDRLEAPQNLLTDAQSSFQDLDNVDFRGNWEVPESTGRLTATGDAPSADARISLDARTEVGAYHFIHATEMAITSGNIKFQLSGDGTTPSRGGLDSWQNFQPVPKADATGAFDKIRIKPSNTFEGELDGLQLFNLSSVDPSVVACDVIIIGGDSNVSNTASELVTSDNRETEFDGRIWYMPGLRNGGAYNDAKVLRHIPSPAIEPVVSMASGKRMSPCHSIAVELVEYSAARGRPLLIMALGEAGSGMTGSKGLWQRDAVPNNNAPRLWDEMVAMKAAVDSLGPAHEIIGMVWSIGANDRYSGTPAGYENTRGPLYRQFYNDLSSEIASVPMVLINLGSHLASSGSENMRGLLRKLDKDSGHDLAVDNLTVVEPPAGNQLYPNDTVDPHFNAAGIQANGRVAGQTLLSLLPQVGSQFALSNGMNSLTVNVLPDVSPPSVSAGENSIEITE